MKMRLRVGQYVHPVELHTVVEFDSTNPDASQEYLGHWWSHEIYCRPGLLKAGARTGDGLSVYEVIEVQSPVFDVDKVYAQTRPVLERQNMGVKIVSCAEHEGNLYYHFFWGPTDELHVLSEQDLMRFLTESVQLDELD